MAKRLSQPAKRIPELPDCDSRSLWDIWLSGFRLPVLTVADELGIFEYLDNRPSNASAVAEQYGISLRASEAMLQLLASLGYLAKHDDEFQLTDVARHFLLPGTPFYWGGVLQTVKNMPVSHDMIKEAIFRDTRSNSTSPLVNTFTDEWEKDEEDEQSTRKFTAKMHSHGFSAAFALAQTNRFDNLKTLLDMGGGSGAYSIALASRHAELQCTVADLPAVCRIAQEYIDHYGMADRIDTLSMDMFKVRWPDTYEAVLFSDILHDWDRTRCDWLIKRCFDTLPAGGRIYLHEVLLDEGKIGPTTANAYSLAMLMVTRGQQFTARELESMLAQAGFVDITTTPSYVYYSLVTGTKP